MRIFFACMFIAAASAAVISYDEIRQPEDASENTTAKEVSHDATVVGDEGYQYNTVRHLKYRNRRDISDIALDYLPPVTENVASEYLPAAEETVTEAAEKADVPQDSAILGDEGYQYKTVRRLKYRHRRDVSELAPEYLPPVEDSVTEATEEADVPQDSSILGDEGYQYKTVRRLKYRHRRDVSELAPEYLPPVEDSVTEATEEADVPQDSAILGDEGYQYKTVRRLKYRHRRDVSELAPEYLPPVEDSVTEATEEADVPQDSAILGDEGYQYKIVRRLKYRHRRDVSELAPEYLPPVEGSVTEAAEEADVPQDSAILGDEGYQYKTVRRLKYRHRRDVSELAPEYLPPVQDSVTEASEEADVPQDSAILGDEGYQYKTVRRLKYRHRRDVSELAPEYLPPVEDSVTEAAEEADVPQDSAILGDEGYQYKTVRRLKYRHRRDVSELAPEYLPPVQDSVTEATEEADVPQNSAILGDEGYQYKTVRRLKYRHRRDVSELAPEYLPPVQDSVTEATEEADVPQDSAILGDEGYQYKTVRRLKYRHRRDVSELAPEYLPPVEDSVTEATEEADVPQDSAILGDEGYQYKTVRRLKYRHRRDVSELAPEYLPPVEDSVTEAAEEADVPQDSAILGDEGYQYKTVRRLKYRHRRDVSELAPEYLPPVEDSVTEAAEEADVPQDSAILGDEGYQYKTVRRLKYRHRRDVSELAPEYLPPVEDSVTEATEEADVPQDSAILGDEGYQYKTVRRLKYRHRRDVSELAPEYLPPAEDSVTEATEEADVPQDSAILGDEGYQYKTVRRLKYRHRRDVSELAPEYLPPVEGSVTEAAEEADVPQDSAILGDEGYQYKTVRRLKYRHRRDVSELTPEYLPLVQDSVTEASEEADVPQDSAILGDEGYQYKTVRRLKYRHRRDVSELAPEYLPPVEDSVTEAAEEADVPQDSAILGDEGYQYKTVRRLKYRNRRDVSELAPEYLPPVQDSVTEATEEADVPQDSAILGDEGYQYKTVRRLKYRHRRDVSELAPEYLPPVEDSVTEATEEADVPQDSAILGDEGYQYKTVRRLKYRHRRDVSELAPEYLPPVEDSVTEATEEADVPQNSAILGDEGYQYKTVRRLKYRHRRDVSELAPEYLPPVEDSVTEATEEADVPQDSAILGDEGYQYKTVRRLKYRHRRDVSELAPEYLPPVEDSVTEAAEEADVPQDSAILGDEGYQYKTVRRLKYRHRRDVSELAPEYLPPVEDSVTEATEEADVPQDSAILGDEGYQYKTVRRLKYRHRRDVSELAPEYLPPVEDSVTEATEEADVPQDSAILGDEGYQYKTVRRLKYKHRRDVSELAPEYLPPVEDAVTEATEEADESQNSALLRDDGYHYRTIKRIRY